MAIVMRVPDVCVDRTEDSEQFLLRSIARWRDDPEVESGATVLLYAYAVNAIIAITTIETVDVFTYTSIEQAAGELSAVFERDVEPEHPLLRVAPARGAGIAMRLTNTVSTWAPRPHGTRVFAGFAFCFDHGIKAWVDTAFAAADPTIRTVTSTLIGTEPPHDQIARRASFGDRWQTRRDIHY